MGLFDSLKPEEADIMTKQKPSFWNRLKEQVRDKQQEGLVARQEQKNKIRQMDNEGIVYCPKCYSTSLSADKKGFGIGKAVVGAAVAGPIGLIAGNINAKKVRVTCLKCGHQFWPSKK
jgi:RNase P subunit RPR2